MALPSARVVGLSGTKKTFLWDGDVAVVPREDKMNSDDEEKALFGGISHKWLHDLQIQASG